MANLTEDLAKIRKFIEDEIDLDDDDELREALERVEQANGVMDVSELAGYGEKIKRRDRNGKRLRIGDKVQVFASQRYGNPIAFVRGAADGEGSKGPRVLVQLADGRDDGYTPSSGRVERLEKAVASADTPEADTKPDADTESVAAVS